MKTRFLSLVVAGLIAAQTTWAQEAAFIQIEAQPSLTRAEARVRDYASVLPDVNGFSLGAGWYGIALGPYSPDQAQALLRQLRAEGRIPRDSYVAEPDEYQSQFWPIGATLASPLEITPLPAPGAQSEPAPDQQAEEQPAPNPPTETAEAPEPAPAPEPEPEPQPADETPREARASEALLDREARRELQRMLAWAGVYTAGIDGAFGRGTRGAMSAWQEQNGFEATGVLTTLQRAELLRQYNAVFDGLDLRVVRETRAGIAMEVPLGVVGFEKYESPFVHFPSTTDLGARVLMISQPGDRNTLFGLYEILQTLEIVPLDGPRERTNRGFTIEGRNDRIVSYTEARLEGDAIKGFTLIWPAGDEERRTRVLARMKDGFQAIDGVLDPGAITDAGQSVDLVSGLQVRLPKLSRSGFYVDQGGTVVTTTEAVAGCARVTLDGQYDASVVLEDAASGIAVLRPKDRLAPVGIAAFQTGTPRIQAEVAVSGYSFGGTLTAPTLTFGTLEDLKGLRGEDSLKRLALDAFEGDAGGPVLDLAGGVIGMLLPRQDGTRQLPADVSFSVNAGTIQATLQQAGISSQAARSTGAMAPEDLSNMAGGMTVLVSCWEG